MLSSNLYFTGEVITLDALDLEIINHLKENSRISASEIGKLVNLSIPAVTERMRKLERSSVITGYTVCLDHTKLGYNLQAYVLVTVDGTTQAAHFREQVVNQPQVVECHHITGEYDYLLKLLVENTHALETFITSTLKPLMGVTRSNTIVVLSTL